MRKGHFKARTNVRERGLHGDRRTKVIGKPQMGGGPSTGRKAQPPARGESWRPHHSSKQVEKNQGSGDRLKGKGKEASIRHVGSLGPRARKARFARRSGAKGVGLPFVQATRTDKQKKKKKKNWLRVQERRPPTKKGRILAVSKARPRGNGEFVKERGKIPTSASGSKPLRRRHGTPTSRQAP